MDLTGPITSVPRLKDSCDACSAFKLRCDKQKPTCARCKSVDRACTYSPARRVGRPHSVRTSKNQSKDKNPIQERPQRQGRDDNHDQDQRRLKSMETTDLLANGISNTASEPRGVSEWTRCIMDLDNSFYPGTDVRDHSASGHLSDVSSSNFEATNSMFDANDAGTDCTTVVLSIMEQLQCTGREYLAVSEACQRLLTVLVCPCSEQADVALLVATACISLMDVVYSSARMSGPSTAGVTEDVADYFTTTPDFSGQNTPAWPRQPSTSPSLSTNGQTQVADLFKIAKVILEFRDRYSQDTKRGPSSDELSWVVAPVVALLQGKLRTVTKGTTRCLIA